MTRGRGKNGGEDLSGKDRSLWMEYTRDIEPLKGRARAQASPPEKKQSGLPRKKAERPVLPPKSAVTGATQPPQLDARTEQRLRRGKMEIEGRIDLHGMTQEKAHTALSRFITRAAEDGKRCVLVITGKGRVSDPGVLKRKFPEWCAMDPLRGVILKILPAAQKDGGSGAWYVYLKRRREY